MDNIEQIFEGVITGEISPDELSVVVPSEAMPGILINAAGEFYRLQAIFRGAPDGHPYKQGAKDRLPGMEKVIEALGGQVVILDADFPLIARGVVVNADDRAIADDVVIEW